MLCVSGHGQTIGIAVGVIISVLIIIAVIIIVIILLKKKRFEYFIFCKLYLTVLLWHLYFTLAVIIIFVSDVFLCLGTLQNV